MASIITVDSARLQDVVNAIRRHIQPVAIYAFGSLVEGRGDEWSDLDIAIFVEGAENWDITDVVRLSARVQKDAGNDVELHIFSAQAYREPERASFASYILTRGVQLS